MIWAPSPVMGDPTGPVDGTPRPQAPLPMLNPCLRCTDHSTRPVDEPEEHAESLPR
jgi:hypothetical protein